jgi:AcrR family transcriptional regulator
MPTKERKRGGTRDRMIASAAVLVRERGARATSIDDVLAHSGAPRGSVYHHFPGGRDELIREATSLAGDYVAGRLAVGRERADGDPFAALDEFLGIYRSELLASDFTVGCPVVAVAIESRADQDGDDLTGAAGEVFERWSNELALSFAAGGIAESRAHELAEVAIAAAEGAIVVSRARRDIEPFDRVRDELIGLLERERAVEPSDP